MTPFEQASRCREIARVALLASDFGTAAFASEQARRWMMVGEIEEMVRQTEQAAVQADCLTP